MVSDGEDYAVDYDSYRIVFYEFFPDKTTCDHLNAFFKVILCRQGKEKAIGFVYRNEGKKQLMEDAVCTVDEIEKLTLMDFFPELDDATEARVEAQATLSDW